MVVAAAEKSKILIIGGTGYIGKFIAEASLKAGHPTFLLVRETTINSDPVKGKFLQYLKNSGAILVYGDLSDKESMVKAMKKVDVVISAVGHTQYSDQINIISAIKDAGNVKKFYPSEYGIDYDRSRAIEPAKSAFEIKAQIRRAIEKEGLLYTIVSSNCFAGYFVPTSLDKITIMGDGNVKVVFNEEHDVGTYIIKTVDDPRTLNKTVYIKPPKNISSMNELVALLEKKIGKTLEKNYLSEQQILKTIQESPMPENIAIAIKHAVFIKGDTTYFEIDPSIGYEASQLYPDVKYTTLEQYLFQQKQFF